MKKKIILETKMKNICKTNSQTKILLGKYTNNK